MQPHYIVTPFIKLPPTEEVSQFKYVSIPGTTLPCDTVIKAVSDFPGEVNNLLAKYVKIRDELNKKQRESVTFKTPDDTDFNKLFEKYIKVDDEKKEAFMEIFAEIKKHPGPPWAKDILKTEEEAFCKRDLRGDFITMLASTSHV